MIINENFPYEKVSKDELLTTLVAMAKMAEFALQELQKIQTFLEFKNLLNLNSDEVLKILAEGIIEDVELNEEQIKECIKIVNTFTEIVSGIPSEQARNL